MNEQGFLPNALVEHRGQPSWTTALRNSGRPCISPPLRVELQK